MRYAKRSQDGWRIETVLGTGEAAEAQVAVYEAQGYKPVRDAEEPNPSPFLVWSASYSESGNEVVESWWSAPAIIRLDRSKLIAAAVSGGWLDAAIAYFVGSPDAQRWWADNMTYVEGSQMASAAMEALGLTLEQAHALVLQCRG